jgi:hypothetical protein
VALGWRLVATTDDVPAELVQHQQGFWNIAAEIDEQCERADAWKLPEHTWDEILTVSIVRVFETTSEGVRGVHIFVSERQGPLWRAGYQLCPCRKGCGLSLPRSQPHA